MKQPYPLAWRIARQKRVQTILKWLAYPISRLGITATIGLVKAGEPLWAVLTGLAVSFYRCRIFSHRG